MVRQAPQRTCLGCQSVKGKNELLRFVIAPDRTLVPDLLSKLPGRGAYTCFSRECVITAVARKQFSRAFKGEVRGAAANELIEQVIVRLEERISSYLSLANKAGKIVSGSDMVQESLKGRKRPGVVLVATDISDDIGQKVVSLAKIVAVPCFSLFDKDKLGSLLGKGLRSVVAVEEGGFIPPIMTEFERYGNFLDGGAVDEQNPRI